MVAPESSGSDRPTSGPNAIAGIDPPRSIDEIHEPAARAALERIVESPSTLGVMLCGSRATGWAEPDGDYDAFVYVTRERYRGLGAEGTQIKVYAEGEVPRRLVGDYSLRSDEVFEEQLRSPLDIDHWPYVDGITIEDRTGSFEPWRRRLAAFPEEIWRDRALNKYLQLALAVHGATTDDARGFPTDRQLNLFRAALAGVNLWFSLNRRWAPPFKWWTREVERLDIRPDTRAVLEAATLNPSIDTATHLRDHLKAEMRYGGLGGVENLPRVIHESLMPERRAAVYRDSYL